MRHPCNAKQSGKSRNFTWLFSHALVTICTYFARSSYPYTFVQAPFAHIHLLYIEVSHFLSLTTRCIIFQLTLIFYSTLLSCSLWHPVSSISTRPSPICPRFPFYTSWGKPFFILNHLYSTFQLTLVFLQAQTSPSCRISSRYVLFFISFLLYWCLFRLWMPTTAYHSNSASYPTL